MILNQESQKKQTDQSVLVRPHSEHKCIRPPPVLHCRESCSIKDLKYRKLYLENHPKKKKELDHKEAGHLKFPQ